MRKFKGDPIEFMPNYPAGDWHRVVEYFQSFYKGTMEKARERADRERKTLFADREKSRIRFDEDNQCWRGRKTKPAYEKFGKRRPGDNPDSLRNVLIREVRNAYLTTEELQTLLEDVYGDEWESKFKQARTKRILVRNKTFGVWHLWTTQPPTHKTDGMTIGNRRTYYALVYDEMDGLRHDSDPEKSEVLGFILSRQPGNDLAWAQTEFKRARQCGAFKFTHEKGYESSRGFWSVIKTSQPRPLPIEDADDEDVEELEPVKESEPKKNTIPNSRYARLVKANAGSLEWMPVFIGTEEERAEKSKVWFQKQFDELVGMIGCKNLEFEMFYDAVLNYDGLFLTFPMTIETTGGPEEAYAIAGVGTYERLNAKKVPELTDEMRDFIAEQTWLIKRSFWQAIADEFDLDWKEVRDRIFREAEEEGLVVAYNALRIRPANMTGLEYCGSSAYASWKSQHLAEQERARQAEDERREREAETKRLAEELRAKQEAEAQALRDQIKAQEKAEAERIRQEHIAAGEVCFCGIWLKCNGRIEPTPEEEAAEYTEWVKWQRQLDAQAEDAGGRNNGFAVIYD
jgi:hypothetical protein